MPYAYYNQRSYPDVPYPSSVSPNATVKSGGCGVVSASIILANVLGVSLPPPEMAQFAIESGARVAGGTDQRTLMRALTRRYKRLLLEETYDFDELIKHLQRGGMAVASTIGNRQGWTGIFSNAPHIYVVAGVRETGKVEVLDPSYYNGKFEMPGRRGIVQMDGNIALISQSNLKREIGDRVIYLVSAAPEEKTKEDDKPVTYEQFLQFMERYIKERGEKPASGWATQELQSAVSAGITDGNRPQSFATREEAAAMVFRALKGE